MQYCVSVKTVAQPGISWHMLCHGEFSNHQIPTFLIKILDKSDLMEHPHGTKNTVITKENKWHHFGFTAQFTYFSDSRRKRNAAYFHGHSSSPKFCHMLSHILKTFISFCTCIPARSHSQFIFLLLCRQLTEST